MRTSRIDSIMVDEGDIAVTLRPSENLDAFDLNIWRRMRHLDGSPVHGSAHFQFGADGRVEEVFVKDGAVPERPTLRISRMIAPLFFRMCGMAADQLGVLPDVVAAQVARLEAENKHLREIIERTDRHTDDHIKDLRAFAGVVRFSPPTDGGF